MNLRFALRQSGSKFINCQVIFGESLNVFEFQTNIIIMGIHFIIKGLKAHLTYLYK